MVVHFVFRSSITSACGSSASRSRDVLTRLPGRLVGMYARRSGNTHARRQLSGLLHDVACSRDSSGVATSEVKGVLPRQPASRQGHAPALWLRRRRTEMGLISPSLRARRFRPARRVRVSERSLPACEKCVTPLSWDAHSPFRFTGSTPRWARPLAVPYVTLAFGLSGAIGGLCCSSARTHRPIDLDQRKPIKKVQLATVTCDHVELGVLLARSRRSSAFRVNELPIISTRCSARGFRARDR